MDTERRGCKPQFFCQVFDKTKIIYGKNVSKHNAEPNETMVVRATGSGEGKISNYYNYRTTYLLFFK